MAPHQHLDWLAENVSWFEQLPLDTFDAIVPSCPGWTVEGVINHLSFGLGLAYPVALSKAPETLAVDAFVGVDWPAAHPTGAAAKTTFSTNMRHCLDTFALTDPDTPCWTYPGAGTARFWYRRAAIETALHRLDVEEGLHDTRWPLSDDRTIDAIEETLDVVLPLAADMAGLPDGQLTVASPGLEMTLELGAGPRRATVVGQGQDVLRALWGRDPDRVEVIGDRAVADGWLSRIEVAFAGR